MVQDVNVYAMIAASGQQLNISHIVTEAYTNFSLLLAATPNMHPVIDMAQRHIQQDQTLIQELLREVITTKTGIHEVG